MHFHLPHVIAAAGACIFAHLIVIIIAVLAKIIPCNFYYLSSEFY
jgi:hypothetical protein